MSLQPEQASQVLSIFLFLVVKGSFSEAKIDSINSDLVTEEGK